MDCPQSCLEYSRVYYYSHICTREKLIGLTHILRQERHPIYSHHGNVSPLPLELIHCQSKHPNNTPVWPAHSPTHSLTSNLTLEVWKMTMCFTVPCFYFENLWSIPTMLKRHWEENCATPEQQNCWGQRCCSTRLQPLLMTSRMCRSLWDEHMLTVSPFNL